MSKPTIPELIVSIYKGDATSTEDAPVTQARRNQRSKVKKQIDNKQLEWKYTLPLIEFCEKNNSEVSEGSMVTELEEDLESERERVKEQERGRGRKAKKERIGKKTRKGKGERRKKSTQCKERR